MSDTTSLNQLPTQQNVTLTTQEISAQQNGPVEHKMPQIPPQMQPQMQQQMQPQMQPQMQMHG